MLRTCSECKNAFNDVDQSTICPHKELPPAGPVIPMTETPTVANTLTIWGWIKYIHRWAHKKGFYTAGRDCNWDDPYAAGDYPCGHRSGNFISQVMLVVTELSEAVEAHRTLKKDEYLSTHMTEEITDAVIRLFDLCGAYNINLEEEIAKKMQVNEGRPHQHGKAY